MSTQPPPPPQEPSGASPQPGPPPPGQAFPVPPTDPAPPTSWQPPTSPPQQGQPVYQHPQYSQPAPGNHYQPAPVVRPASMDKAVWAMRAGAVMVVVSQLVDFLLREQTEEAMQAWMKGFGVQEATNTSSSPVLAMVSAAFAVALWLWMSVANGKGRTWARALAHVFFGLHTLTFLVSLGLPTPPLSKAVTLLYWACGLAAIIFIWAKDSRRFYAESSREL
ncbi:hypothetical protein [Austwickia chelonae]|uniref:hypothetical protein n=1 Tax=Austwickia chelonae TaxID=100225 RepID=UPI0013C30A1F|nr:hypothetical protein [Austwickia chelonae]